MGGQLSTSTGDRGASTAHRAPTHRQVMYGKRPDEPDRLGWASHLIHPQRAGEAKRRAGKSTTTASGYSAVYQPSPETVKPPGVPQVTVCCTATRDGNQKS